MFLKKPAANLNAGIKHRHETASNRQRQKGEKRWMCSKRHRQHAVKSRENMRSVPEPLDDITWFEEMNPPDVSPEALSDRTEGNRVSGSPRLHRPPHCKRSDMWTEWSSDRTGSDPNTANNTNTISRQHLSTAAAQIQSDSQTNDSQTLDLMTLCVHWIHSRANYQLAMC